MSYIITGLAFFIIFSVLVLVHEWGHFIMAKRAGIKVEEFGFGLPPRLWGKKKGETIYSINWIPFGGFVRMYGEDTSNPALLKSSRSFVAKPMRARVKVVVAGVVMNFLLAWLLIFIGFSVGMQPLLGPDDVLPAIAKGQIVLEPGVKVKSVEVGSLAEKAGFKANDVFVAYNGAKINNLVLEEMGKNPIGTYEVLRDGTIQSVKVEGENVTTLGLNMYDFSAFPRVKIHNLDQSTELFRFGLRPGDVVITVNGQQVYTVEELETMVRGVGTLEYEVFRDGVVEKIVVDNRDAKQIIISEVVPGSSASKAGILPQDVILTVNGQTFENAPALIEFVQQNKEQSLSYAIERGGQALFFDVLPVDGRIGVYLSELMKYGSDQGLSLYNVDLVSSVVEIKDEKYPVHIAIYKSLQETWRLSEMTAKMFVGFVGNLVSTGEIPDSVAGPIGIAQMTHVFVQEGIIPLLRFVAILSLSLAVINILPFPALDGGRLLFILIEFIIGRRVSQKWESYIHALGYILILLMILTVTYSDIMRLITG